MIHNPYTEILEMTKGDKQTGGILIGYVVTPSPLVVKIRDLQIDRNNLLVSDHLLSGYSRSYNSNRKIPDGSSSGVIKFTDTLKKGDKLAVISTNDKQTYIVLSRLEAL